MTGITHRQTKVALNSIHTFAIRVECANIHDPNELGMGMREGVHDKVSAGNHVG